MAVTEISESNNKLENLMQEKSEEETESEDSETCSSSSSSADEDDFVKPFTIATQYLALFLLFLATIAVIVYLNTSFKGSKGIFSKTSQIVQISNLAPRFDNAFKFISNKTSDLYETVENTMVNILSVGAFLAYYLYESILLTFSQ